MQTINQLGACELWVSYRPSPRRLRQVSQTGYVLYRNTLLSRI